MLSRLDWAGLSPIQTLPTNEGIISFADYLALSARVVRKGWLLGDSRSILLKMSDVVFTAEKYASEFEI